MKTPSEKRFLRFPANAIIVWARMRIRAFFIIAALLAFPLQASSAHTAASPPLPPPRPAEAPSHPAPNDLAPAEQTQHNHRPGLLGSSQRRRNRI
jgi:hypothetical protein